jgi:hypothetical protein
VATLCDTSILHNKTWANYLVLSFNGSMPCIHSPYSLSPFLQQRLWFWAQALQTIILGNSNSVSSWNRI